MLSSSAMSSKVNVLLSFKYCLYNMTGCESTIIGWSYTQGEHIYQATTDCTKVRKLIKSYFVPKPHNFWFFSIRALQFNANFSMNISYSNNYCVLFNHWVPTSNRWQRKSLLKCLIGTQRYWQVCPTCK